jgi:hypothetical protein
MEPQRGQEHERGVVVRRHERERPGVVDLDIQNAGEEDEQRAPDQQGERESLEAVGHRLHRGPLEQLGDDRPQLGQEDGDRRQPGDDVEALGDRVQVGRRRGPREEVEVEAAGPPEVGVISRVREEAGDRADHDQGQQ